MRGALARRALAEARHVRGARTGLRFRQWLFRRVRWRLQWRFRGLRQGDSVSLPDSGYERGCLKAAEHRGIGSDRAPHVSTDAGTCGRGVRFRSAASQPDGVDSECRESSPLARTALVASSEVNSHRLVKVTDSGALRRCHHVEDVQSFHAGLAERAATLVRMAALGVPVYLADGGGLECLLGPELHARMASDMPLAGSGPRELVSMAIRRAALRGNALQRAGGVIPKLPSVSVLVATRRPDRLGCACQRGQADLPAIGTGAGLARRRFRG